MATGALREPVRRGSVALLPARIVTTTNGIVVIPVVDGPVRTGCLAGE